MWGVGGRRPRLATQSCRPGWYNGKAPTGTLRPGPCHEPQRLRPCWSCWLNDWSCWPRPWSWSRWLKSVMMPLRIDAARGGRVSRVGGIGDSPGTTAVSELRVCGGYSEVAGAAVAPVQAPAALMLGEWGGSRQWWQATQASARPTIPGSPRTQSGRAGTRKRFPKSLTCARRGIAGLWGGRWWRGPPSAGSTPARRHLADHKTSAHWGRPHSGDPDPSITQHVHRA